MDCESDKDQAYGLNAAYIHINLILFYVYLIFYV